MSLRPDFYCSERRPLFRGAVREKAYPVMQSVTGILFSFDSGGFEADGINQLFEIV